MYVCVCVCVCVLWGGGGGGTSAYLDKPDHWRRGPSSGVGRWVRVACQLTLDKPDDWRRGAGGGIGGGVVARACQLTLVNLKVGGGVPSALQVN